MGNYPFDTRRVAAELELDLSWLAAHSGCRTRCSFCCSMFGRPRLKSYSAQQP